MSSPKHDISGSHSASLIRSRGFRRRWMEHEDLLIDRRINWLLTSQSILFAAYVLISTQQNTSTRVWNDVIRALPLIGLALAISILLSVVAAICTWRWLGSMSAGIKDLTGPRLLHFIGMQSYVLVPSIFVGAWVYFITGIALAGLTSALVLSFGIFAWYWSPSFSRSY